MQPRKLFQRPFDITLFRRASPVVVPPNKSPSPLPPPEQPRARKSSEDDETLKCFDQSPPDLAAGVQKPIASPPRPLQPPQTTYLLPDVVLPSIKTATGTDAAEDEEEGEGGKKRKKHKKEKKHRRCDDVEADADPFTLLCLAADSIVPAAICSSAGSGAPAAGLGTTARTATSKRPYEQAFDPDFETYMAGQGQTVNDEVKHRHATDVASVSTAAAGGKSMGDRKYGCLFCGGIHQLESVEKGTDPPCLRNGAFAKFIQDFLFRYDIAPEQEWRRMFMFKTPGYRRAMADRFATITSHDPSDAEWTSFMHRRAWETRSASFKSNAGIAKDLFHQHRIHEFVYFNSAGSSSPRPGSAIMFGPISASPVNLDPPPIPCYNPFWISGPLPPSTSSSATTHHHA